MSRCPHAALRPLATTESHVWPPARLHRGTVGGFLFLARHLQGKPPSPSPKAGHILPCSLHTQQDRSRWGRSGRRIHTCRPGARPRDTGMASEWPGQPGDSGPLGGGGVVAEDAGTGCPPEALGRGKFLCVSCSWAVEGPVPVPEGFALPDTRPSAFPGLAPSPWPAGGSRSHPRQQHVSTLPGPLAEAEQGCGLWPGRPLGSPGPEAGCPGRGRAARPSRPPGWPPRSGSGPEPSARTVQAPMSDAGCSTAGPPAPSPAAAPSLSQASLAAPAPPRGNPRGDPSPVPRALCFVCPAPGASPAGLFQGVGCLWLPLLSPPSAVGASATAPVPAGPHLGCPPGEGRAG